MGALQRLNAVVSPARLRTESGSRPGPADAFWYTPEGLLQYGDSVVGPDTALALTHVYSVASIICDDFGTRTCQAFEDMGDDGNRKVEFSDPGIGNLAWKLRWQPNNWQTAKAFWSTMAWQFLFRPAASAEIIYRADAPTIVDQIIPRHPDRVRQEPLTSGRRRYRITEPDGSLRYVNGDEMMYVPNTSIDGLNAVGRMTYGSKALAAGLALQQFTRNFFQKGVTGSLVVNYKGGQMEEEAERDLHASITRYISGAENAGGVLLIPEDITTATLGVDPQKAELLGLKKLSGADACRLFKVPPSKAGIEGTWDETADEKKYINHVQVPLAVEFEQAVKRDMIVAPRFFIKFNMDYLLRAATFDRMKAHEIAIRSRIYRPSTAQRMEDLPVDYALDRLSEMDFRPGTPRNATPQDGSSSDQRSSARAHSIALAAAERVVRRETSAIAAAAKKHGKDDGAFMAWARSFYGAHADFVASVMGMPQDESARYCREQLHRLLGEGLGAVNGWEAEVPEILAALALEGDGEAA